ncbi:MAG: hypothetical protein WCJ09_14100, partial [Planctomycetota bacterium]
PVTLTLTLTLIITCSSYDFVRRDNVRKRSLGHDREDSGLNNSGSGVTWSGVTGASPIIRRGRVFCSELVFHDFCFFRHGSIVQLLSRRFRCGVKASLSPG